MRAPRTMVLMTAGVMALAGCSGGAEGKSGAEVASTTLVLATRGKDLTSVPGVQYFVDRVRNLSEGRMTIRIASRWGGGDSEVDVLQDVAAGKADLGGTGTRALDQVGVRGLTPLNAPFLVDSYAKQKAVLTDSTVTEHLSGLHAAGLVGLALIADNLRLPVGTAKPLLSVKDYADALIAVPTSGIQTQGLAALGAVPYTDAFNETTDGADVSWDNYTEEPHLATLGRFVTANTPLWPRSLVVFANPGSLDRLSDQERDWVRTAAYDAARWSVDHARDEEVDQIKAACANGVKVAYADANQTASLHEAVQTFYQTLRGDSETAPVMLAVERLTSGLPPDSPPVVPEGCEFRPGDESLAVAAPEQLTAPGRAGALPEGVYRYELTAEELRAAGLPEDDVYGNAGVTTWTLHDGRWSYQQLPANPDVPNTSCEGYYDVTGNRIALSVATVVKVGECAPLLWTATWSSTPDTLTWSDVSISDLAPTWAPRPWRKIG